MSLWGDIFAAAFNGKPFWPDRGKSSRYQHHLASLDIRTCQECRNLHGKIYGIDDWVIQKPPLHVFCRCRLAEMETIRAGTATMDGTDGADWWVQYRGVLPEWYVSKEEATIAGWDSRKGNLAQVLPGRMIGGEPFYNRKGKLPQAIGRVWYEADINYTGGYRNDSRLLYSNDGLLFVTYDHYEMFYEIVGG